MKNILYAITTIILFISQEKCDADVGLFLHTTHISLSINDSSTTNFGWGVGAILEYKLGKKFSILSTPKISFNSSKITNELYKQDQFEIPLSLKYKFYGSLYGFIGPNFNFLTYSRFDDKIVNKNMNTFVYTLTGGLGYECEIENDFYLNVFLTFNYSENFNQNLIINGSQPEIRDGFIDFNIGFTFPSCQ